MKTYTNVVKNKYKPSEEVSSPNWDTLRLKGSTNGNDKRYQTMRRETRNKNDDRLNSSDKKKMGVYNNKEWHII